MVPGGPLERQTLLVTPKYHLLQHHIEKQCFRIFLMRTKRPTGVAQIHGVQCHFCTSPSGTARQLLCACQELSGAMETVSLGLGSGKVSRRIIKKLQSLESVFFFKQGGLTAVTPVASNQWVYICVTIYLKAFLLLLALNNNICKKEWGAV